MLRASCGSASWFRPSWRLPLQDGHLQQLGAFKTRRLPHWLDSAAISFPEAAQHPAGCPKVYYQSLSFHASRISTSGLAAIPLLFVVSRSPPSKQPLSLDDYLHSYEENHLEILSLCFQCSTFPEYDCLSSIQVLPSYSHFHSSHSSHTITRHQHALFQDFPQRGRWRSLWNCSPGMSWCCSAGSLLRLSPRRAWHSFAERASWSSKESQMSLLWKPREGFRSSLLSQTVGLGILDFGYASKLGSCRACLPFCPVDSCSFIERVSQPEWSGCPWRQQYLALWPRCTVLLQRWLSPPLSGTPLLLSWRSWWPFVNWNPSCPGSWGFDWQAGLSRKKCVDLKCGWAHLFSSFSALAFLLGVDGLLSEGDFGQWYL